MVEGRRCSDVLKKRDGEVLDGIFLSLQKVVVENGDVATDEKGVADECETSVCEREEEVSKREVFKKEVGEEERNVLR